MNGFDEALKNFVSFDGILEFVIRGIFAVVLGTVIGLERQWKRHPVGVTNILVCAGSFFFTSFSFVFESDLENLLHIKDMTRMAAQVVVGIGFLGAGLIMRRSGNVKGLNTAATIWCAGSVGVLCAWGTLWRPVIATLIIIFVNTLLHPVANKIRRHRTGQTEQQEKEGLIRIICEPEKEFYIRSRLMQMVAAESIVLHNLQTSETEDKIKIKATVSAEEVQEAELEKIISLLSVENGVISAGWYEL